MAKSCGRLLPKMMLVCLVSTAALSSSHDSIPCYLDHLDISYLRGLTEKAVPLYTMDFGTHQALSYYDGLCRVMEVFNSADRALPFSRTEYEKGFTIFGFDFTPGGTSRGALTIIKQGNLNLILGFRNNYQTPLTALPTLFLTRLFQPTTNAKPFLISQHEWCPDRKGPAPG